LSFLEHDAEKCEAVFGPHHRGRGISPSHDACPLHKRDNARVRSCSRARNRDGVAALHERERWTDMQATDPKSEENPMKSMEDMLYALMQDVYYAEKQLLKVLPKMAKESAHPELEKAFMDHRDQTQHQIERLDRAFAMIDRKPKGKKCDAILGIIAEGEEVMEKADGNGVKDAGLIGAAQAAEHYEIARYGTLCAWAKQLGKMDLAELLHKTLEEEKKTDSLLTSIAKQSVNQEAAQAA
jgi:ferritin-like metal-binding protein YciE